MSGLSAYAGKTVLIITSDGRLFTGTLEGFDQTTNLILSDTKERIIHDDEPTEVIDLGVYLLRGTSVVLCGLVDTELDDSIDWTKVRGSKLHTIKNSL
ncbi:LSM8 Lsm protein-like protein [Lipomyces oligophaga]|uniref:LSM8 Lsm protein-like protein n=1 Tax=Lipomyces oligophaga TaxID=45792 RepID=UPI0034CE23CE